MAGTQTQTMSAPKLFDGNNAWSTLETLVNAHWERLCGLIFHLIGDWDEAEDIVLEAFVHLVERPPRRMDQPQAWLYRVAMRLGMNALRARSRRRIYEEKAARGQSEVQEAVNVERAMEQSQQRDNVRKVLAEMNARQAQMLLLYHSGFHYAEIANMLQVSPSSVGTMLARAEKTFAKLYRKRFASFLPSDEN